jgi:hypothetical protein
VLVILVLIRWVVRAFRGMFSRAGKEIDLLINRV